MAELRWTAEALDWLEDMDRWIAVDDRHAADLTKLPAPSTAL